MSRSNSPVVSDTLASHLTNSLPIYVSAEDVDKHPDLSQLLNDLTHRITSTGVKKTTNSELTHATHAMKHARQKFLDRTTFHRLVQDVVYQKPKEKTLNEAKDAVIHAELQSHLQLVDIKGENGPDQENSRDDSDLSEKQYLFGITPKLMTARAAAFESIKSEVSHEVEKHLANEWTKIAAFHDPVGFLSYDPDEVIKIPEQLEVSRRSLTAERKKLVHSAQLTDYLFLMVRDHLVEYGNILKTMMSKYRVSDHPAKHIESLDTIYSTILLKLKCIELEILLSTYTSSTVPALKYLHSHISDRSSKAERRVALLKQELSSFDHLDAKFKDLLSDYAKIQADIAVYKPSLEK